MTDRSLTSYDQPLDALSIARLMVEMPRFNEQVRTLMRKTKRIAPMVEALGYGAKERYHEFTQGKQRWLTIPELVQIYCYLTEQPVPPYPLDLDGKGLLRNFYPRPALRRARAMGLEGGDVPGLAK